MLQVPRRIAGLLVAAAVLAACAGSPAAVVPTSAPPALAPTAQAVEVGPTITPTSPEPTPAPRAATEAPVASEGSATAEPAPPLAEIKGEVQLSLGVGGGVDQAGVDTSGDALVGPRSFRIGADGSIRVLDNVGKRVLFFKGGKPGRVLSLANTQDPWDFIVNNAGEVFVFDKGANQVLRYGPDGKVTATIAIGQGVSIAADGLMLTAEQDLMLVQGNQFVWTLVHKGVGVPPEIQTLTRQEAASTPRSPALFQTTRDDQGQPYLRIVGLTGGIAGDMMVDVDGRSVDLPADARFFNVDRAMNLYFSRTSPDGDAVDFWRVLPDGTTAGGGHIATGACGSSWRTIYVDQAGAAWTMCASATGTTITRYALLDSGGKPLPEAAGQPADVAWKPGARFSAA
jgi:hypothetical protein